MDGAALTAFNHGTNEQFVRDAYLAVMQREPDPTGFQHFVTALDAGSISRSAMISEMSESLERWMTTARKLFSKGSLPNLMLAAPNRYMHVPTIDGRQSLVFHAKTDDDFDWLENHIKADGFYESMGEWTLTPDESFKILSNQIRDVGGKSVLELGCSTGNVIKELLSYGVDAEGIDVSHLALAICSQEIRSRIHFGDLLNLSINRKYDTIVGLDVFEHLNPRKIDSYISKCASLLNSGGCLFINSPIFGHDRIFGEVFSVYLEPWKSASDGLFRHIEVDSLGWPSCGHLIWATAEWWEKLFLRHGLVRNEAKERMLQDKYADYFRVAPARKSIMVLQKTDKSPATIAAGVRRLFRR